MFTVRPAQHDDRPFIGGLVESLLEFGSPMWRRPGELADGYRAALLTALDDEGPEAATLIAEDRDGRPLGFISLRIADAIGSGPRCHIADLAVSREARRRGVGTTLVRAAEVWCAEHGLDGIDLDVWATNERALAFYRSLGYVSESQRLVKTVGSPAAGR